MLKKLRNKMLLMNMLSTFFLIVLAFAVIFTINFNSVQREIDESLFRAFAFHRPVPERFRDMEAPPIEFEKPE